MFFIAGTFFQFSLKNNNEAHLLTLPVSSAEKLIYSVVVLTVLGFVIQLLTIAGVNLGYWVLRPLVDSSFVTGEGIIHVFDTPTVKTWDGFLVYVSGLSIFLFGSIYFKKLAFIKTISCGLGFSFIVPLYNLLLNLIAFGNATPFAGSGYPFETTSKLIIFHVSFYEEYLSWACAAITLFFFLLTYLRLKETEV
jgi:hypothetical protein